MLRICTDGACINSFPASTWQHKPEQKNSNSISGELKPVMDLKNQKPKTYLKYSPTDMKNSGQLIALASYSVTG